MDVCLCKMSKVKSYIVFIVALFLKMSLEYTEKLSNLWNIINTNEKGNILLCGLMKNSLHGCNLFILFKFKIFHFISKRKILFSKNKKKQRNCVVIQ